MTNYKFILGILSIFVLGILFISPAFASTTNKVAYNANQTKNIGQSVSKVPVMSTTKTNYIKENIRKTPKVKDTIKQDSKPNTVKKIMHEEGLDLPVYYIDSCQDINKPGYYILTKDILFNQLKDNKIYCIDILTGNVYLDGDNHKINYLAQKPGYYAAISVDWDHKPYDIYHTYKNINIKNIVTSSNFMYGIFFNDWTIESDLENINLTNITSKNIYLNIENMKDSTFKDNKITKLEIKNGNSAINTNFINNNIKELQINIGKDAPFNKLKISEINFVKNDINNLILHPSRLNLEMKENKINSLELYKRYVSETIYGYPESDLLESLNISNNDFNDIDIFYDRYGGINKGIIAGNNIYNTAKIALIGENILITNNFGKDIEFYIQRHCGLLSKDTNISNNTFGSFTLLPGRIKIYDGGYTDYDPFIFQLPYNNVFIYNNKINQFNILEKDIPKHGMSYYNLGHDFEGKKIYISNNTFETVQSTFLTSFSETFLVFKDNSCYSFEFTPEYSSTIYHESNYCKKYPN